MEYSTVDYVVAPLDRKMVVEMVRSSDCYKAGQTVELRVVEKVLRMVEY